MLPSSHRLPHGKRIPSGTTFKHSLFLLKTAPNKEENSRFGIIISKKIDKRAVRRNRMRRLLQQFIQDHMLLFPQRSDYLFILHSAFEDLPEDLQTELTKYFNHHYEKSS